MATLCGIVTATSLLVAPAAAEPAPPAPADVVGLVVTREQRTSAADAQRLVEDAAGVPAVRRAVVPGVTAVTVPGLTADQARAVAREVSAQDGVADVGLDTRVTPALVPTDPLFAQQWSLTDTRSGIRPQAAWDVTRGAGAVIAVIDSGLTAHEDLAGQGLPGYDFVSTPVVANDGDGRDADPSDPGDWVDASDVSAHPDQFTGCPQEDSTWHGTHVAGLAAALQDNGKGITGVAPAARILPVRVLGKCGGTMSDIVAGLTWASGGPVPGVPDNPNPADVINLSLSSNVTCQPFVQAAVDDAIARGSVVVASAGNSGVAVTGTSPAGCYDVLAVGAVERDGDRAPYSNSGVAGRDRPLFAPGGLKSDGLRATVNPGTKQPVAGSAYGDEAGTSMAAPLVSGAAALLAASTTMSPQAIVAQLRLTARAFPDPATCPGSCGVGILDVGRAVTVAPRLPAAVTGLAVQPGDGSLALEWAAPPDPGSAPVTGYSVELRPAAGTWGDVSSIWSSTLPQKVLTGLSNGVGYQVRVAARNVFGVGSWTESAVVAPLALPGPVRIRAVRYPSAGSARVSLSLPAEPLQALEYRLLPRTGASLPWTQAPVAQTLRLRLAKGVRFTLQVRGVNALGASSPESRRVATPVRPTKVRGLAVTRKGRTIVVRWGEPRRTGLFPAYRVRVNDGAWRRTKATRMSVRAPGRVRVQVQARNEAGRGPVAIVTKRK